MLDVITLSLKGKKIAKVILRELEEESISGQENISRKPNLLKQSM